MKHLKKISAALLAAALCLGCAACGQTGTATTADSAAQSAVSLSAPSVDEIFTDRDSESGYSDYCTVTLADGASTADADGVTIDRDTITITAAGTYLLTGTLSDGQLIVDAGEDEKVQLVLSDASITCSGSAALYCRNADKVFVTTANGTGNELISTGEFAAIDDSNIDGAIYAKCDLTLNGAGTLTLSTGDDGIHANDALSISGGIVAITQCYEGIESAVVDISGGDIDITASDDGINAADGTSTEMMQTNDNCVLTISGGTITINAEGDGVDSNGDLTVTGGTLLIDGSSNGGNGALDYDGTGTITGGTVIALDQPGMAMNFGFASTQATALVTLDSQQAAGNVVTLTDAEGNVLLTYTARKAFQSVLVSCPNMAVGLTYTLTAGEETQTIELTETVNNASSGMGGAPGQMGGEIPAQGERPDRSGRTDDDHTPPDFDNSTDRPEPPADGQFPGSDTNSADTSA